jgi:hypothetical protein
MTETERNNNRTDKFQNDPRAIMQAQLDDLWQARRDEVEEHRRLMQQLNEFGLKI